MGVSFYLYMAVSGMTNPPMEWGYPRTVEGFFHAISRGQYEQPNPTNLITEPRRFLSQLGMLIEGAADEFTWVYHVHRAGALRVLLQDAEARARLDHLP